VEQVGAVCRCVARSALIAREAAPLMERVEETLRV